MEQYKKGKSASEEYQPEEALVQKVLVVLSDGKLLELAGEIKLTVDRKIISNTDQLKKLPNGDWSILPGFSDVSLTLLFEDDFFADL